MESLDLAFNMLSLCGIWRPLYYSKRLENMLYNLYRIVFIPMPYLVLSSVVGRLILENINPNEMAEAFFICLTMFCTCSKSVNIIFWRKDIIKLINKLTSKEARLQNNAEQDIWRPYAKIIRYTTIALACYIEMTVGVWIAVPFFQNKEDRNLPFKIWLPYAFKVDKIFWIIYVLQSIAILAGGIIYFISDIAISGFMIAICGQFDILSYRLQNLPNLVEAMKERKLPESEIEALQKELLVRHVRHHLSLFECAEAISNTFRCTILTQFITSSIIISISVYQLSIMDVKTIEFFSKVLYVISILTEFFIYCWFGNELSLKSQEFGSSVLKINWRIFSPKFNKQLLIMTIRCVKPIIVSGGYFIVLSLDSFTKIMKTSYTVFNLLRT